MLLGNGEAASSADLRRDCGNGGTADLVDAGYRGDRPTGC